MLIFYCFVSRHSGERVATGLSYLCKRNHGKAAVQRAFGPVQGSRFNAAEPRFKVQDSGFKFQDSRFKIQDSSFRCT